MFRPALVAVVLLLSVGSGYAQTGVQALGGRATLSKDQIRQYLKLAENGDVEAQLHLAYLYETGIGVPKDFGTALILFGRAAVAGDSEGQMGLGRMYALGRGVAQDYTAAAKWFRLAAEQGEPIAMRELGACYVDGLGVPVDYDKAHEWWQKAAALGNPTAMADLGTQYERGQGVVADVEVAIAWYERGIAAGSTQAPLNLGRWYVRGDRGIAVDVARGIALIRSAAEGGSAEAAHLLAGAFASGDKVKQDGVEALTWFIVAAELEMTDKRGTYEAQRDRVRAVLDPGTRKLAEERAEAILAPLRLLYKARPQ